MNASVEDTFILYETGNTQIAVIPVLWLIWDIAKMATGS